MAKKVVILGGGAGGLVAANRLKRILGDRIDVLLIDRRREHIFYASFLWLMVGKRKPSDIQRHLSLLKKKGIDVVHGEITAINPEFKYVSVDDRRVSYDYLIVSLGADLAPGKIPGLDQTSFNLYDLEGVVKLQTALQQFPGGKIGILIGGLPFKCPAAPYEAAFLVERYLRKQKIREKTSIDVITPESLPMPTAGPMLGNALKDMLGGRGINFNGQRIIESVDPSTHKVALEDGASLSYDLMIAVPPHQAPAVVAASPLAGAAGWILVDPGTLATQYEGVYAIGDVTAIPLPGRFVESKPLFLPKAGVFAHYQADVVAHNIARQIQGAKADLAYKGNGW